MSDLTSQATYWHVRISPTKKSVILDYREFVESVMTSGKGFWDNDTKNRIQSGDFLGFITGPTDGNEQIHIYKVIDGLTPEERLSHWKSDTPYTTGNGVNIVSHRQVIVLTNDHLLPKSYSWRKFRSETGLGKENDRWMPRGTEKVNRTLPFDM
jgi:hypothetical protein